MKRFILSSAFLLMFIHFIFSQTNRCYTDEAVSRLRAANPAYDAQIRAWKTAITQAARQTGNASGSRGQLYTIPIVFHVVLSSQSLINSVIAQIPQQVATLNRDFRKQNSDTSIIRSIFKPLASDIEIEFCLAARDPSGNATSGYDYVITSHGAWDPNTQGDDMKFDANGGKNAWNTSKYVNVWIVDIAGSFTGGYAYIGSAGVHGSNVDGIVLDYDIGFGSTSRSLSHEMGHYFGLYHPWGDLTGGCSDDDGISDTPVSESANYYCDFNINSCITAADLPDQVENHMDYSFCPVMFTAGQKAVMRNVLTGVRSSLITNNLGCQGVNVKPDASFSASSTSVCPGSMVAFTDNSLNIPTSWSWTFQGGTPSASNLQHPIVTYSAAGVFTVTLTAANAFGSDTETKTGYITVGATGGITSIFLENFEGSFPGAWTVSNPDNGLTWEAVTVTGSPPGSRAARVNNYNYNSIGQRDGLISPPIDLTGRTQLSLTFNYAHRRNATNQYDSLIVRVSTDGGTTYPHKVFAKAGGAGFATGYLLSSDFVPATPEDWCAASATGVTCPVIDLSSFSGQSNVRIKFETYNDSGNNIYIDNLSLTGLCTGSTGAPVADFTASPTAGCDAVTVNFTDLSANNPTSWSWQFSGGNPATSTQRNPTVTYGSPGSYNVTLTATNVNGSHSNTKTGYITVYASPSIISVHVDASCPGVNNGSIDLTVIGGTPPFTYQWSNAATTQDISGLSPRTYAVTVTDARGCTASHNVTIASGPALQLSASVQDDVNGAGTGSVSVSVANGTAPYTYQWSSGGSSTAVLSGLTAGTYLVTVTDANGCQAAGSFTVQNTTTGLAPIADFTASQTSGCDALTVNFIDLSANNPTAWSWQFSGGNPAASTSRNPTVHYNSPGSYHVTLTVTNASGSNTKVVGGYITVYDSPLATVTKEDASCPDVSDGSADLQVTGGTQPYSYQWSNGAASEDLTGAAPGNYSVTVTDLHGCTAGEFVQISPGASLQLSADVAADTTGAGAGSISLTVTNGTPPYIFQWSHGANTASTTGLTAGVYSVTVTDAAGCRASQSFTVTDDTTAVSIAPATPDGWAYAIYPNPTKNAVTISVKMHGEQDIKMVLYNSFGKELLRVNFGYSPEINALIDLTVFDAGIYFLRMESGTRSATGRVLKIDY